MLHRSASSRRRRASRSVIATTSGSCVTPALSSSIVTSSGGGVPAQPRGRRASLASTEPAAEAALMSGLPISTGSMERQRSPRASCVPNIALNGDGEGGEEMFGRRLLPDPEQLVAASRLGLAPDTNRSSRLSLVPDDYVPSRSPRGSLVPDSNRSPRNSLIPESGAARLLARNSLVPEVSRSPRHSLVPDSGALSPRGSIANLDVLGYNRSPRGSIIAASGAAAAAVSRAGGLMPENGGRSPRHSLVPEPSRSPRGSVANIDFDRSPRGSICPDTSRSPRGSVAPLDMLGDKKDRSPRGSIASECINQSPRGSIAPDMSNRSPRGSIAPQDRSPRGSIGGHRGSLGGAEDGESTGRSPRGSIGPELDRSPRGSIGGGGDRRTARSGFQVQQEPRRSSADKGTTKNATPYIRRDDNTGGSIRSAGSGTAQINLGYNWNVESRRPSSSVSQFSGDESRRLCEPRTTGTTTTASCAEKGGLTKQNTSSGGPAMGVAAYGSLVFQLKDAHFEANGTCDFVYRALRVVSKTMVVTIALVLLATMPIVMLILGVQYIRDCPREPHIPVYMVVGGTLGALRMFWTLYSQIRSRRPEVLTVPGSRTHISPKSLASFLLTLFLLGWFALGNYWILSIKWPDYSPTLFEPNKWCHKTLYIFSLTHLVIVYIVIAAATFTGLSLLVCRLLACPWPERYK